MTRIPDMSPGWRFVKRFDAWTRELSNGKACYIGFDRNGLFELDMPSLKARDATAEEILRIADSRAAELGGWND